MRDLKVKDIMTTDPLVVHPDDSVKKVAEIFVKNNIGGAPVVDEQGKLVGIVTDTDLVMQDVKLHFPTFLHLLDGYIFLQGYRDFENELKKAVGATVSEVMSRDIISAGEDASVEDVATLMIDNDVDRIPVVTNGKLVGVVGKSNIIKLISRS